MKKLDISPISDSSQMPLKKGTLQFLQDSYYEIVNAVMSALVGPGYDPTVVYMLYGGINGATAPAYNITAGAVFYNGEVFLMDGAAFTTTGTNVAVISIIQTQYTTDADPVTFTDSAVRNVHNIRKIQVTQGAAGSTIANYGQVFFLNFVIPKQLNLTQPDATQYPNNTLQILGAYPNFQLYVPQAAATANPILAAGSLNVGDIPQAGQDFTVTFPTAVGTGNYYVQGTIISQGASANADTSVFFTVRSRTTTGFVVHFRELPTSSMGGDTQNIAFEYVVFKK